MPYRTFEMRLQELLFEEDMSMREISAACGKRYSTLMREISPWDGNAKLGLVTFIRIVQATHDDRLLALVIRESGFMPDDFIGHEPSSASM